MERLNDWLRGRPPQPEATGSFALRKKKEETPSIICVGCEQRVPLWDEMEQCFASLEIQQRVRGGKVRLAHGEALAHTGRGGTRRQGAGHQQTPQKHLRVR